MKKVILLFIISFFCVLSFSQDTSISKYSKEIDCELPETYNVSHYLQSVADKIDLEKYKINFEMKKKQGFEAGYDWSKTYDPSHISRHQGQIN